MTAIPHDVRRAFYETSLKAKRAGFERYSADAILHRIRWHQHIERGNRDFKCNNNWTAQLARDAMRDLPELAGFFVTRQSQHDDMAA